MSNRTATVYRLVFRDRRDGSVIGVTDWFDEIPDNPTGAAVERMTGTPEVVDGE